MTRSAVRMKLFVLRVDVDEELRGRRPILLTPHTEPFDSTYSVITKFFRLLHICLTQLWFGLDSHPRLDGLAVRGTPAVNAVVATFVFWSTFNRSIAVLATTHLDQRWPIHAASDRGKFN